MKRETDLFKIEEHPPSDACHFTADIDGPYMDGDGNMYVFVRRLYTEEEIKLRQKSPKFSWKKAGLE